MQHLIAVMTLAVLVAGWYLLTRWIARTDPELPGINRRCGACPRRRASGEKDDAEERPDKGPCHGGCKSR